MAKSKRSEYYEFVERMSEQLATIPVEDVIGKHIPIMRISGGYKGLCPWHPHRSNHTLQQSNSFKISPERQIWKCFACADGRGGNHVKFMSYLTGKSYREAAFDLALEYGIITPEEYDKYSNAKYGASVFKKIERDACAEREIEQPERAPEWVCQKAYQIMFEMCRVSEKRRKELREKRRLSDSRIDRDYLEMPKGQKKKAIVQAILDAGVSPEDLIHVPGFYRDKRTGEITFQSYIGTGILIRDYKGNILGIQVRKDKVKDKKDSRYVWLASTFAFLDKEKYEGGCGSGSPKDVLWPKREALRQHELCITEGRFKSEILTQLGWVAISVQGVGNWRGIDLPIQDIARQKCIGGLKIIRLLFDSDIMEKRNLFEHTERMVQMLKRKFPEVQVYYHFWDKEVGKGIDDYLLNGGDPKLMRGLKAETVAEIGDKTYENVLHSFGVEKLQELQGEKVDLFMDTLLASMEAALGVRKQEKPKEGGSGDAGTGNQYAS